MLSPSNLVLVGAQLLLPALPTAFRGPDLRQAHLVQFEDMVEQRLVFDIRHLAARAEALIAAGEWPEKMVGVGREHHLRELLLVRHLLRIERQQVGEVLVEALVGFLELADRIDVVLEVRTQADEEGLYFLLLG